MQEENYTVYFEVLLVKIYCLQGNMPPPHILFLLHCQWAILGLGEFKVSYYLSLVTTVSGQMGQNCLQVWRGENYKVKK